jgi:hypothetical protein
MILREDPEPDNLNSLFIPFSSDRNKVTLAKDKGAAGVLLVNGVRASQTDKPMDLEYDQNLSDAGIPVFSITRQVADQILMQSENSVEQLEETIIKNRKSIIVNTSVRVEAKADVKLNKAKARNVVFSLPAKHYSESILLLVPIMIIWEWVEKNRITDARHSSSS